MNHELPDVQAGFRKSTGTGDQIVNICWIIEKPREIQKNIYFCIIDYAKAFDSVDQNKLWKILQEMGNLPIPGIEPRSPTLQADALTSEPPGKPRLGILDHLTCLLRNLHAGQEATVKTGHGTMDWFQIGKVVCQGCMLSPCLFNLYAEYIMRNARLDEAQARIKIAGRSINNLRYADDTNLMAGS